MHRKDRRRDHGGLSGDYPFERFKKQYDRNQVQQQIDGVISGGIPPSQLLVEPEGRIGERANREWAPKIG